MYAVPTHAKLFCDFQYGGTKYKQSEQSPERRIIILLQSKEMPRHYQNIC